MREKIVRRRLSDGTIREYRYSRRAKRVLPGSIGALILEYRQSSDYTELRPNSKRTYEQAFREMEPLLRVAVADIRRRHVIQLRDMHKHTPAMANSIRAVFSRLMNFAVEMEYRESNPAYRIKKIRGGHYDRWEDDDIAYALANLPGQFARPIMLALYTGQRQSDVLAMTWADYDGEGIEVTQTKTQAKIWIPCHAELKAMLDEWRQDRSATTICVNNHGVPWRPETFHVLFAREKNRHANLRGLQFHGLRKTAAAKLAEAGCSLHEIAAVTGHRTLAMLTLYTDQAEQRTRARAAIVKLENAADNRRKTEG